MGIFTLQSAPALLRHGSASKLKLDTAARPLAELIKQYIAEEKGEDEIQKSFLSQLLILQVSMIYKSPEHSVSHIESTPSSLPWRPSLDKRKTALSRAAVQLFSEVKHVSVWQSKLLFWCAVPDTDTAFKVWGEALHCCTYSAASDTGSYLSRSVPVFTDDAALETLLREHLHADHSVLLYISEWNNQFLSFFSPLQVDW